MLMRGLFHRPKHRGTYDWHIQEHCVAKSMGKVRQVHTNLITGECWMEQIQCNTEPVYLGHV